MGNMSNSISNNDTRSSLVQVKRFDTYERRTIAELLVNGFVRNQKLHTTIPTDIISLFFQFYFEICIVLKWSPKYIGNGIKLSDDNKCATRSEPGFARHYVLADTEPVVDGIHCWRVQVKNPPQYWMWFGVSERKQFVHHMSAEEAFGISTYNEYCPLERGKTQSILHNNHKTVHFVRIEGEIDILLDVDKGKLSFCKVGDDDTMESKLWNLPIGKHGWVPHFNLFGAGQSLRIANIPIHWYSKEKQDEDIFKLKNKT